MGLATSKKPFPSLSSFNSLFSFSWLSTPAHALVAEISILQSLLPSSDTAEQGAIPIAIPTCISQVLPFPPLLARGEATRLTTHRRTLQVKASLLLSTCRLPCFNYLLTG